MRKSVLLASTIGFLVSASPGLAYEVATHEDMSEAAAFSSVLTKPGTLSALGLTGGLDDPKLVFPNSEGKAKTIKFLIRDGSRFEDNLFLGTVLRVRHHFYDPLYNRPLTVLGVAVGEKSPDWALEDNGIISSQEYSYRDARDYFYRALTATKEDARNNNFGLTFQTLGHVIHHVQDMAQPQHVRNDIHPNIGAHKSLYEDYTDRPGVRSNLMFSGYNTVTFPQARSFWTTGEGKGLAEYTNANFLSTGTNFLFLNGQAVPNARYTLPVADGSEDVPVATLFAEKGKTVPEQCKQPGADCRMAFYATTVWDKYLNKTEPNKRASTLSLFDQDLQLYGKKITYQDPDTGQSYTTDRLFALNEFNFDAAHKFLIPRAVAYSAGLVDYFFRGRLEAVDVLFSGNGVSLRVQNAIDAKVFPAWTNEIVTNGGKLVVAYEYKIGNQTYYDKSKEVVLLEDIAPGATSVQRYLVELPSLPPGAGSIKYRLVYRGKIGQEEDAVAVGTLSPSNGFLVAPSYVPTDGITGDRQIYKHNDRWVLTGEQGIKAGNVDWKGWYVNGTPTVTLSWGGPSSRYFSADYWPAVGGKSIPNFFGSTIFMGGRILTSTPTPVLGATIAQDAGGKKWLVAVCRKGDKETVYRRAYSAFAMSDNGAFYDPVSNPDGWREMQVVYPVDGDTLGYPLIPWFFNGNGTEAQTIRRGRPAGSVSLFRWRLKLEVSLETDTARIVNLRNGDLTANGGVTAWSPTEFPDPFPNPCPTGGVLTAHIHNEQRASTTDAIAGSYVIAVDYGGNDGMQELLATLDINANSLIAYSRVENGSITNKFNCDQYGKLINAENISTDVIQTITRHETTNYTGTLEFGNYSIEVDARTVPGLVTGQSRSTELVDVFASGAADLSIKLIDAMDLRYNFVSLINRKSNRSYEGKLNANEPGVLVGSGFIVTATTDLEQNIHSGGNTTVAHSVVGPQRRFREGFRNPDLKSTTTYSGSLDHYDPPVNINTVGHYAHDVSGNYALDTRKVVDLTECWGYGGLCDRDAHSYMERYRLAIPTEYYGPSGFFGVPVRLYTQEQHFSRLNNSPLKEVIPEPTPTLSGYSSIEVIH